MGDLDIQLENFSKYVMVSLSHDQAGSYPEDKWMVEREAGGMRTDIAIRR